MPEIGETLRDARMRARIDVSEIEAKTKIRAKYLRALENEEWGLLPGPTFVKSFLRTYAEALGLDGKALVEEYRLSHENLNDVAVEPIVSSRQHARPRSGGRAPAGPSRRYMVAVGVVGLVIVLLLAALLSGGGTSNHATSSTTTAHGHGGAHTHRTGTHAPSRSQIVSLSLTPTATVYVCLIGEGGRKLIPGSELHPGASTPTFHSRRFEITLGNASVTMFIDGRARAVPPSSQPIGYVITKANGRRSLAPGQLPTCT
ncbi:MAG: helix-turn-helix domain-containing protein [Solirubrobacteraceae bacterium]